MRVHSLILLCSLSGMVLEPRLGQTPRATIVGRVTDATTREALPNVNVFLAGTSLGAATDRDGKFHIKNVPLAAHELVASMVGYQRRAVAVHVFDTRTYAVDVRLEPVAIELKEIDVVAKDPKEWRKHVERFQEELFGETRNAKQCSIINPEVLDFRLEGDLFEVAYHVPILIENRALGYRIEMFLEEFRIELHSLQYKAKTRFEHLTPHNDTEASQWVENRRRAYYGSRTHFLKALAQGRTQQEGFEVSLVPSVRPSSRDYAASKMIVNPEKYLMGTENEFQKRLTFPNVLEIIYTRERAEPNFQRMFTYPTSLAEVQVSWLTMNRLTVLFTTDGHPLDSYGLKVYGYWAFERVAELLPLDYDPTKE